MTEHYVETVTASNGTQHMSNGCLCACLYTFPNRYVPIAYAAKFKYLINTFGNGDFKWNNRLRGLLLTVQSRIQEIKHMHMRMHLRMFTCTCTHTHTHMHMHAARTQASDTGICHGKHPCTAYMHAPKHGSTGTRRGRAQRSSYNSRHCMSSGTVTSSRIRAWLTSLSSPSSSLPLSGTNQPSVRPSARPPAHTC